MAQPRRVLPAAAAALTLILLAGCTPGDDPDGGITATPEPTATARPTPEPTGGTVSTPIGIECDELVPPDVMYIYSPNVAPIGEYTPAAGSAAESALAYQGIACRWQNQSSGANIDLSVANLDEDTLTALKNTAFAESQMVPTYGEEAYFTVDGGVAVAQVFQGPYWIVAESTMFFEPGDATELIEAAIAGLGA